MQQCHYNKDETKKPGRLSKNEKELERSEGSIFSLLLEMPTGEVCEGEPALFAGSHPTADDLFAAGLRLSRLAEGATQRGLGNWGSDKRYE